MALLPFRNPITAAMAYFGRNRDHPMHVAANKIRLQRHELQRWYNATLDRESRALELKHEVNELLRRLNEPIR